MAGLLLVGCSDAPAPSAPLVPSHSVVAVSPPERPTPASAAAVRTDEAGGLMRYVALGDSYTIGVGVKPRDRWPNQLARVLRPGTDLDVTANLALNGNTTNDVIRRQLPQLDELDPQFVSLLIGVNDVIQNVPEATYRANVGTILDAVLRRVPADRVVTVATPDYTLTPHGADFADPADPSPEVARQSATIARFNDILQQESEARGIAFVDIGAISGLVPEDPALLAQDELHPSGKQYAGWVELIAPLVRQLFAGNP